MLAYFLTSNWLGQAVSKLPNVLNVVTYVVLVSIILPIFESALLIASMVIVVTSWLLLFLPLKYLGK
ncbi:hypothetical protein [Spiroplasma sp. AdecLV25b]|uniref:hypothetical protein n=1 Tax=Spiroplasma sp. AdecLV25b TaxID=3027162 RepID=UPI0027E20C65|nr:hypothetical protein [Spiroplasma sp. AdecLV25b]